MASTNSSSKKVKSIITRKPAKAQKRKSNPFPKIKKAHNR